MPVLLSNHRLPVATILEGNFADIPDLYFKVVQLVADSVSVASRLQFDCTPKGRFLGMNVDGRRVSFFENVFYEFREGKIWQVWSVIDKVAIEEQLGIRE
jgi:predicted ester cyclase